MQPETLIARWKAWDERPGNEAAAKALVSAVVEYAGLRNHNDLYRHVAAQRRAGLSISAAIYTWTPA